MFLSDTTKILSGNDVHELNAMPDDPEVFCKSWLIGQLSDETRASVSPMGYEARTRLLQGFGCDAHEIDEINFSVDSYYRAMVAGSEYAAVELLEELANDPAPEVRASVAWNPACPAEVFARFASDHHADVRKSVATLTDDPEVLDRLASDPKAAVRANVITNRHVEQSTLTKIADAHEAREHNHELYHSGHEMTCLASQIADPRHQIRFATADAAYHRHGVANNPLASPEVRALASIEPVRDVISEYRRAMDHYKDANRVEDACLRLSVLEPHFVSTLSPREQSFIQRDTRNAVARVCPALSPIKHQDHTQASMGLQL